jgi:hypothetical protein
MCRLLEARQAVGRYRLRNQESYDPFGSPNDQGEYNASRYDEYKKRWRYEGSRGRPDVPCGDRCKPKQHYTYQGL